MPEEPKAIPLKETEPISDLEITFLPDSTTEYNLMNWYKYFDPDLFEQNISLVEQLRIDPKEQRHGFIRDSEVRSIEQFKKAITDYRKYTYFLNALRSSPQMIDSLKLHIPQLTHMQQTVYMPAEMSAAVQATLKNSAKKHILLSGAHTTTYSSVEALAKLGVDNIGLFIFDRHTDFYVIRDYLVSSSDYQKFRGKKPVRDFVKPEGMIPGKGNIIWRLFEDGYINAVNIDGVPYEDIDFLQNPLNNWPSLLIDIYNEHKNRIGLVDERNYIDSRTGEVVEKNYRSEIIRQLEMMNRQGVKNIAISVDPDCLRTKELLLSPMEFNSFSTMLDLGLQDFSKIVHRVLEEAKVIPLERDPDEYIRTMILKHIAWSIQYPKFKYYSNAIAGSKNLLSLPVAVHGRGKSLDELLLGIKILKSEAQEMGMETRIALPNGGYYMGDIVELSPRAPDYQARTAQVVKLIVQEINDY